MAKNIIHGKESETCKFNNVLFTTFLNSHIVYIFRYAKGLILEYWRKQQANSPKDTSDEQSKVESIINAKLSAKPPEKRTWNDIDCVVNVYHCGNSILFAEVKWKSDEEYDRVNNTFIPTRILRKTCPLKVSHLYLKKFILFNFLLVDRILPKQN